LHTVLQVSEQIVRGYPYFRLNLHKDTTNSLGLKKGDTVTILIETVKRDGMILYQAKLEEKADAA
jgi:ribosomal protein L30/L7E